MHLVLLAGALALVITLLAHLDRSLPHGRQGWRARISTAFAGFGSELGELNLQRPTAVDELKAERASKLKAARTIAEKAEAAGRDFTRAERLEVNALIAESKSLGVRATKAAEDAATIAYIDAFDASLPHGIPQGSSKGRGTMTAPGPWGYAYSRSVGYKDAIAPSGSLTVPLLSSGIAELQDKPATFLSAISFVPLADTNSFSFVQESLRELNATSVRPGHLKPTSDIELVNVEDRARVVAHLSRGIDRSTLADSGEVARFLDDTLRAGVELGLEAMVLTGDSTDVAVDDFDGLLSASGTKAQPFASDILTTLRKSLTGMQDARLSGPFIFVMSPTVWEGLELLTSDTHHVLGDPGNPGRTLPIDTARQALWGCRVALSPALEDDVAILGDFSSSSIRIREREACRVDWSEGTQLAIEDDSGGATASGFELNRLQFRAEGRYGLELRRPWAFAICDLTA